MPDICFSSFFCEKACQLFCKFDKKGQYAFLLVFIVRSSTIDQMFEIYTLSENKSETDTFYENWRQL